MNQSTKSKVEGLRNSSVISKKMSDLALARFYGIPKIYKIDTPFRPIVALQGSPIYNLARWLAKHLRPHTLHSPTTVRSAEHCFGVTSPFTSIPKGLAAAWWFMATSWWFSYQPQERASLRCSQTLHADVLHFSEPAVRTDSGYLDGLLLFVHQLQSQLCSQGKTISFILCCT